MVRAALLLAIGSCIGMSAARAQSQATATQPSPRPAAARIPYSRFPEIHVDQDCRLLPYPPLPVAGRKKAKLVRDPMICHLEAVSTSTHNEESIAGNELRRTRVEIAEREYILQNITARPVIFVVEHPVPLGWVIDSDPQPALMDGQTAIFHVQAQPGELVRLHVGARRTNPLRSKPLKVSLPAPSGN